MKLIISDSLIKKHNKSWSETNVKLKRKRSTCKLCSRIVAAEKKNSHRYDLGKVLLVFETLFFSLFSDCLFFYFNVSTPFRTFFFKAAPFLLHDVARRFACRRLWSFFGYDSCQVHKRSAYFRTELSKKDVKTSQKR